MLGSSFIYLLKIYCEVVAGGGWRYAHLVYMSNFEVLYRSVSGRSLGAAEMTVTNSSFRSIKFIRPTSLAHCHAVHYALFTIHRMVFGKSEVIIQLRPILFWYSVRTPDSPTPTVNRWAQHNTTHTIHVIEYVYTVPKPSALCAVSSLITTFDFLKIH